MAEKSIETLRKEFALLRKIAGYAMTREEFDAQISAKAPATPEEYVAAAAAVSCDCDRCGATGVYSWGAVINGRPSHTGDCYRCEGKGWQGQDDFRRNYGYDNYAISAAFAAMFAGGPKEYAG